MIPSANLTAILGGQSMERPLTGHSLFDIPSGLVTMDLAESYLDVPFDERWELLKPNIVNIDLEERVTIAQLAKRMADDFSFKAERVAPRPEAPAHHQPRQPRPIHP